LHVLKTRSIFKDQNCWDAGCRRTAGTILQPGAKREHLPWKNPVATAPGSDLANASVANQQRTTNHEPNRRRQLFDDIMKRTTGVMGILPIRRIFLETARFS
jgi:hypothetical protein